MNHDDLATALPGSPADCTPGDPAPDDDGERELILWTLSLTPEERLAVLEDFVETFWTPRHG